MSHIEVWDSVPGSSFLLIQALGIWSFPPTGEARIELLVPAYSLTQPLASEDIWRINQWMGALAVCFLNEDCGGGGGS